MEIKYEITDDRVRYFTESAKSRLIDQSQIYTQDIISEAERIEEIVRENEARHEITENIIFQAVRRNKAPKKKNLKTIVLNISSDLLLFFSGLMFNPELFITETKTFNIIYFVIYMVVTIAAIIITIIIYFIDGE